MQLMSRWNLGLACWKPYFDDDSAGLTLEDFRLEDSLLEDDIVDRGMLGPDEQGSQELWHDFIVRAVDDGVSGIVLRICAAVSGACGGAAGWCGC